MRVPGYCTGCRKLKPVKVSGSSFLGRGVVTGICATCEDEQDKRKETR